MLKDLRGPRSAELFRQIAAREPERTGVARAERAVRRRGDLESRCDLARAHLMAGHVIPAERLAYELCRTDPDEPLAWTTLARVLEAGGRYRDAARPAREALARGADVGSGRVLLARILNRLGPDGREESTALAAGVLEAHPDEAPVGSHDLAEGGADRARRRGRPQDLLARGRPGMGASRDRRATCGVAGGGGGAERPWRVVA